MRLIDIDKIRTKNYEANCEIYGDGGCIICGRPLNDRDMNAGHFLHWLPNGDVTDSTELDGIIPDSHDLGWWQVGNTCYKNFLKAAYEKPVLEWRQENNY